MTKTTDYEIVDYGIENASYFQGHGTSFTRYEHCTLGAGDTYREALDDALDSAAQMGTEIELTPEEQALDSSSVEEDHSECESELYYYVGLRWN